MKESMRAYSYARYSSTGQRNSSSLKRQSEVTESFCKRKGYDLDSEVRIDEAVSAYKGDNVEKGVLGTFIKDVESGKITTPCVLCVEALDRVTRLSMDAALPLFQKLLKMNVTIASVFTGKEYTPDSANSLGDMINILIEIEGANQYSERLSKRLKAAWRKKKERAGKKGAKIHDPDSTSITSRLPFWIKEDKSGNRIIKKKEANIVKRIFEDYLSGMGVDSICNDLNERKVPTPFQTRKDKILKGNKNKGKSWSVTSVRRLLRTESVIGRYVPQQYTDKGRMDDSTYAVDDYFEPAITKTLFFNVQTEIEKRKTDKGSNKRCLNLFTGLVVCADCGWPMNVKIGAATRDRIFPKYVALQCSKSKRKAGCKDNRFHYFEFENGIITALLNEIFEYLYAPKQNKNLTDLQAKMKAAESKYSSYEKQLNDMDAAPSQLFDKQMKKVEEEMKSLERRIESTPVNSNWDYPYEEITEGRQQPLKNDTDTRRKVKSVLQSLIERVDLHCEDRTAVVYLKIGLVTFIHWGEVEERRGGSRVVNGKRISGTSPRPERDLAIKPLTTYPKVKSGYLPDPYKEILQKGNPSKEKFTSWDWRQSLLWIDPEAGEVLGLWDKE